MCEKRITVYKIRIAPWQECWRIAQGQLMWISELRDCYKSAPVRHSSYWFSFGRGWRMKISWINIWFYACLNFKLYFNWILDLLHLMFHFIFQLCYWKFSSQCASAVFRAITVSKLQIFLWDFSAPVSLSVQVNDRLLRLSEIPCVWCLHYIRSPISCELFNFWQVLQWIVSSYHLNLMSNFVIFSYPVLMKVYFE